MIDCQLMLGNCLELMKNIPDKSIDMILVDPPYGTTSCKWDIVIPIDEMFENIWRVLKDNGACCIFGSEPFSSKLRMSQLKNYKYDWYWDKKIPSGMCNAKIKPMSKIENIIIFIKGKSFYYPQMINRDKPIYSGGMVNSYSANTIGLKRLPKKMYDKKFPMNLITFDKIRRNSVHPTQKPVPLLEYLIKTYTLENEVVLDFTMGSGSTGVACKNLNRKFIGIEKDEKYFDIAVKRINGEL